MANQAEIKAVITAEDRASGTLKKFTHGTLGGIESGLKTLAIGLAVGGAAATAFGVASFRAFQESERAGAMLEHAVIGVTHATKEQLAQTNALAEALMRKGVLDDDTIKQGLAQLSTFGLQNKSVQDLAKSMADLTVNQFGVKATGEQAAEAANMMAKALRGQFGVLERSGIRFTEAQKAIISFGTEQEKVAAINEGFAQNLKYTNDVAKETAEGAMARLSVAFGNLQETIGGTIAKALVPFINSLSEFISSEGFKKWVEGATEKFGLLMNKLSEFVKNIWPTVKAVWDEFVATLRDWVVPFIKSAKDAIKEFNDQYPGLLLIAAGIAAIGVAFAVNPVGAIIMAIAGAIIFLHKVWVDNSEAIKQKWIEVKDFFTNTEMGKAILEPFVSAFNSIRQNIGPIMTELKVFWKNNKDTIIAAAAAIGVAIYASFVFAAKAIDFLTDAFRILLSIVNKVQSVFNGIRNVSADLGKWIAQSTGIGKRAMGGPVSSNNPYIVGEHGPELFMPSGSGKVIPTAQTQDMLSGTGGGGTVNLNVNVGVYAGTDVEKRKVAQSMFEALQDIARSKNISIGEMLS